MIELKQVTKQYRQTAVLNNITLSIDEPGIYCLLGRNGAGKTTLLKSIAGYQNITKGVIKVDGRTISTSALSPGVSYIENFSKHFNLPVRRLLQAASQVNPDYDYDFALEMMERFELDGKKIKVLESRLAENPQQAAPGTVLALKPLTIACARGALQLLTVTPEGGRPMAGTAWAAGRRLHTGDSL